MSELVTQGLSNQQVANRMYVSVNTAASYMRQIFRKLNIGSRVELARIAIQQSQQPQQNSQQLSVPRQRANFDPQLRAAQQHLD